MVTFLTYRYGHAIFDYIEQEHGKEGLRSFLFEYRKVLLSNNLEKAFKEAFGYGLDEFNRRFNRYLRKKYFPVLMEKQSPDEFATEIGVKKPGVFTFSPGDVPLGRAGRRTGLTQARTGSVRAVRGRRVEGQEPDQGFHELLSQPGGQRLLGPARPVLVADRRRGRRLRAKRGQVAAA